MSKIHWLIVSVVLLAGCGKPAPTGEPSASQAPSDAVAGAADQSPQVEGPAAAASEFLEAIRTGNDDRASKMLTNRPGKRRPR